jgi:dihydroorotase
LNSNISSLFNLIWDKNDESGNTLIDEEHKTLLNIANRLIHAVNKKYSKEDCLAIINELIDSLTLHFSDEEDIFFKTTYPLAEHHKNLHKMLIDNTETLSSIFKEIPMLIATHCEDEATILQNKTYYRNLLGDDIPVKYHPLIRSEEACYRSSSFAVELATKFNARLHVLHVSTERELSLFDEEKRLKDKKITSEVCVHHLWFSDKDYKKYGNRIKWNPAIKTENDRLALAEGINSGKVDVVATDHAPHLWSEKEGSYFKAASGGPMVQHALVSMLQLARNGLFKVADVVDKMCHGPAELYRVSGRGYIRVGYYADLVLIDPGTTWTVTSENILYRCGWSPFEGTSFDCSVMTTWVNGNKVFDNNEIDETFRGRRLNFYL